MIPGTNLPGLRNNHSFILKNNFMPIVKVIEVIASSENSFDDAIKNCLAEVSKTVHNIDSIYVKDFKVHVKDGKAASYGIICKVSFRVDQK
jgi:dodecin